MSAPASPLEMIRQANSEGSSTKRFRIRTYLKEWRRDVEANPLFIPNQFIILELPVKSGTSPTEWELQLRRLEPATPSEKLARRQFRIG